jgi:uncharacterized protein involved in exopolysaccharide biosynthesis
MGLALDTPRTARDELESVMRLARRTIRHWRVGVATFVVVLAATLSVAALRPRQYRSEAVVYYREGLQWSSGEGTSPRRIGQRLKDMLLARAQLAKIVEEFGLYPKRVKAGRTAEAVEELRLAIGFKVTEGDVFVISFSGDSPAQAQRVTAKLSELLIAENMRFRSEQAEDTRAFLDAEKKRNAADLSAKEAAQLRFLARHPEFAQDAGTAAGPLRAKAKDSDASADREDEELGALRREEDRLRRQIGSPGQVSRPPQDPALVASRDDAEA